MALTNAQKLLFWGLSGSIALLALLLQSNYILHWDVRWLTRAAERFLSGGSYTQNYFETNPPMIIYLSLPALYFQKWLHIKFISAIYLHLTIFITFAALVNYYLLKKIFSAKDKELFFIYFFSILVCYLLLPVVEFGQREHILFIFTMPYLNLTACRLKNIKVNSYISIAIGFFAGCVFSIKPFFVVIPFFIEAYYLIAKKDIFGWCKPETITMIALTILYYCIFLNYHPDYFTVMIPYLIRNYYQGLGIPWEKVLISPYLFFTFFPVALYAFQYRKNTHKELSNISIIGLVGFTLATFMQPMLYYYHYIPPFFLNLTLLAFFIGIEIKTSRLKAKLETSYLILLSGTAYIFLWFFSPSSWTIIEFAPNYFYGYCSLIIVSMLYIGQKKKNFLKAGVCTGIIIAISVYFSYLVKVDDLHSYHFLATVLILGLMFSLFIEKKSLLILASLVSLIYYFPFLIVLHPHNQARNNMEEYKPFIEFFNTTIKNHSVYFFTSETYFESIVFDYTEAKFVSRFPFLWMVPGLFKQLNNSGKNLQTLKDKNFFVNMLVDDFSYTAPDFVVIDEKRLKPFFEAPFEYLDFLLVNKQFSSIWKNYHYYSTIQINKNTKFGVYKHNEFTIT